MSVLGKDLHTSLFDINSRRLCGEGKGRKNVTRLHARKVCPELVLVPQTPDLYRHAHNALLAEINSVIPVSAIKSIDELTCKLAPKDIDDSHRSAADIKRCPSSYKISQT